MRRPFVGTALEATLASVKQQHPKLKLSSEIMEIGQVVCGNKPGRVKPEDRVIAIQGGVGTIDVVLGSMIYQQAKQKGIGQVLPFTQIAVPLPPKLA